MRKFALILGICISSALYSGSLTPGQRALIQQSRQDKVHKPITIIQNSKGGQNLELSNGTTWEVYKKDTVHSGGWLGGDLDIEKQNDFRRDGKTFYRYKIYNHATNDSVWARQLDSDN